MSSDVVSSDDAFHSSAAADAAAPSSTVNNTSHDASEGDVQSVASDDENVVQIVVLDDDNERRGGSRASSSSAYAAAEAATTLVRQQSSSQDDELCWDETFFAQLPLSKLRTLASKGRIPDEWRGRAWRRLLGYYKSNSSNSNDNSDGENNKNAVVDADLQRQLYADWVRDSFQHTSDVGSDLGRKRKQQQQQQQEVVSELESCLQETHIDDSNDEQHPNANASESSSSHHDHAVIITPTITSPPPSQPVPSHVKEWWKKKGLDMILLERLTTGWNALVLPTTTNSTTTEEKDYEEFMHNVLRLDEIRKDVVRTHPDLAFYLEPRESLGQRRYAVLERILFVWSKYNKGIRYVQGMNEIVGTIYYVLAHDNDDDESSAPYGEADTYWLLTSLLTEIRDIFVPDLDDADTGIQGRIASLQELLAKHDPEVKEHLDEIGIDPSFFAIRWWTTLLSREFLLPDTIRLWDSMFASTHKDNFLRYVCVTMVLFIREDLLRGDFSTCLRLLQAYPSTHMDALLESTRALWIYESQITMACHKGGISLHQALKTIAPPPAIIMAFGLRNGSLKEPEESLVTTTANVMSRSEQLEQAGEKAAASVRDATNAMATSAQGLFGRATRLYSKYSQEYTRRRSQSADRGWRRRNSGGSTPLSQKQGDEEVAIDLGSKTVSATPPKGLSPQRSRSDGSMPPAKEETPPEDSPEDSVYMEAILNA